MCIKSKVEEIRFKLATNDLSGLPGDLKILVLMGCPVAMFKHVAFMSSGLNRQNVKLWIMKLMIFIVSLIESFNY